MKVDWTRVPDWIDWVAPEENHPHNDKCIVWCSKPELEEFNGILEFTNYYCTDDDGLYCELPHDVATREDSDLLDFENAVMKRPNL
jgi:hypothetical protein